MSQHDYTISDQNGASFLADLLGLTQAIVTNNSGTTAPSTTYAGMIWLDTTENKIKRRNQDNDGWVILGDLDEEFMGLLSRAGGAMSGVLQLKKSTDIASGATTDLGTADGNDITITHSSGTVAITSFGGATSLQAGTVMDVTFSISGGTLSLTHNATSMFVPGGNNLPLADKDKLRVRKTSDSSANWEVIGVTKADGSPLVAAPDASATAKGIVELLTEGEYETGTDATRALTASVARAKNVIRGSSQTLTGLAQVDTTGLPAWITNILIQPRGVSMSSTQAWGIQIGDSGGLETAGYEGAGSRIAGGGSSEAAMSNSFLMNSGVAAAAYRGHIHLSKVEGTNTWVMSAVLGDVNSMLISGGEKTLSGTLNRFSFIAASGTFDGGSFDYLAW